MMRTVSIFCLLLAALPVAGLAQEGRLTVVVLEGEGAFNNIKRRLARDPIVEVRDEYGKTVTGAEVVFTLPEGGPSATFAGGGRKFTVTSDAQGRAQSMGLRPNDKEGRYNIKVSAALAGKTGSAILSQSNTLAGGVVGVGKSGMSSKTKILIAILIGGGAGGGAYAATRGGGSSAAAAGAVPTSLSAGAVTVGGPR